MAAMDIFGNMASVRFFENMLNAQDQFDPWPHIVALLAAYILAIPIGWNREHQDRSAGIRTFPLVAIAACGFVRVGQVLFEGSDEAMASVIQGVITGIGFIGGGAILQMGKTVRGTATAAGLWATGAIGIAAGYGIYDVALVICLATICSYHFLSSFKEKGNGDAEEAGGEEDEDDEQSSGGCCCCRNRSKGKGIDLQQDMS